MIHYDMIMIMIDHSREFAWGKTAEVIGVEESTNHEPEETPGK